MQNQCPREPSEGVVFKTAEDAIQFHNLYAYQMGFGIARTLIISLKQWK